jgi:hypothetical protein
MAEVRKVCRITMETSVEAAMEDFTILRMEGESVDIFRKYVCYERKRKESQSKLGLGTAWIHQIQMARVGHFDAMEKKAEADSAIENLRAQPEVRSLLVGRSSACEGTTMPELMLLLFGPQTATPIFRQCAIFFRRCRPSHGQYFTTGPP